MVLHIQQLKLIQNNDDNYKFDPKDIVSEDIHVGIVAIMTGMVHIPQAK